MGSINLYKIVKTKQNIFIDTIENKGFRKYDFTGDNIESYVISLYYYNGGKQNNLSWAWILDDFHINTPDIEPLPKAILVIKHKQNEEMYAATFGYAHFDVNDFCDSDFGFNIARRIEYENIKLTAQYNPNSKRNRTVNQYIDTSELIFESGEAFAKLKEQIILSDNLKKLVKPTVEFGTSVKFDAKNNDITTILSIIDKLEETLQREEKYKIPLFKAIKDDKVQEDLFNHMPLNALEYHISEIMVVGTEILFNGSNTSYIVKYKGKSTEQLDSVNEIEIKKFTEQYNFSALDVLRNAKIEVLVDGQPKGKVNLIKYVEYTDEERYCVLNSGTWYKYNVDYLNYLENALSIIEEEYQPNYDFTKQQIEQYNSTAEKELYKEAVFNALREQEGFENIDRELLTVGESKIEVADLYCKEFQELIAVKIGNSSSKLCYVTDQSLSGMNINKICASEEKKAVKIVTLWIILQDHKLIPQNKNGSYLNNLNMLVLKNSINEWQKKVLLNGYKPKIRINYYSSK